MGRLSKFKQACPRCGEGELFDGLLSLRDGCANCGLDFTQLAVDDGAAFFIIGIVSAVAVPLAVAAEFLLQPPVWVHFIFWPPAVFGGAVAPLRPAKAMLANQYYRHLGNPE